MSFVSFDYAKNLMRTHQVRFWKLKDSDNRSVLGEQRNEDLDVEQSIHQLEQAFSEIEGKYVILELRGRSPKERGSGGDTKTTSFELRVSIQNLSGQGVGIAGNGYMSSDIQRLTERINQLETDKIRIEHKFEIDSLKKEISELKEGNPALDAIIAGLGNLIQPKMAPNGAAPEPAQPVRALAGVDQKKPGKIQAALKRLAAIDSQLIETLECLAAFAESNPDQYTAYVQMLKSQMR